MKILYYTRNKIFFYQYLQMAEMRKGIRILLSLLYFCLTEGQITYPLSSPRSKTAVTSIGDYALFAGGLAQQNGQPDVMIDIFNFHTIEWKTAQLQFPRSSLAAASLRDAAYFAGGKANGSFFYSSVEVFNLTTMSFSKSLSLSEAREGLVGGTTNDLVLFAGGTLVDQRRSNKLDIFNQTSEFPTTMEISVGRSRLTSVSTPEYVLFAGGRNKNLTTWVYFSNVDVFCGRNRSILTFNLPEAKSLIGSTYFRYGSLELIFFAGGENERGKSKRVDVFDGNSLRPLYSFNLSQARDGIAVVQLESKVLFVGGTTNHGNQSDLVEVFDPVGRVITGTWKLSFPRLVTGVSADLQKFVPRLALFTGGISVDAFKLCTRESECGFILSDRISDGIGVCHADDHYCIPLVLGTVLVEYIPKEIFYAILVDYTGLVIAVTLGLLAFSICLFVCGIAVGSRLKSKRNQEQPKSTLEFSPDVPSDRYVEMTEQTDI
jgi:hypothetical protein